MTPLRGGPRAPPRRRAPPTWCWWSSTTWASPSWGATAPTSPRRSSTAWPPTGVRLTNFHTTALCSPDPLVPAHRAQPPPQRPGSGGRPGHRVPRLQRRDPQGERVPLRDPAPAGLRHLRRGQVAPDPRRRDPHGRPAAQLAAGPRASTAGTASTEGRPTSSCRPSTTTTTRWPRPRSVEDGLPPERRPGRPGHQPTGRPACRRRRPPVLPLLLPPGPATPPTTPRRSGSSATGAGSTRDGTRWRERDLRPAAGRGAGAPGHRAVAPAALGAGLGRPGPPTSSGWPPGSWSASPATCPTPTPSSAGCSTSSTGPGDRDDTLVMLVSDNGASAEGGPTGSINDNRLRTSTRPAPRSCPAHRRDRRAPAPTTTTRGAGPWPATPRSGDGNARSTRAAWPIRAS